MKTFTRVFLMGFLCGVQLWGVSRGTRKLSDYLHRSDENKRSPGGSPLSMSQVSWNEHLKEPIRTDKGGKYPKEVPAGDVKVQVGAGGVKALHLSLAGAGQVRAMWMNPVPFTDSSDFKPQCSYQEVRAGVMLGVKVAIGRAYTYTAGRFKATLNEAVMEYKPGNVPVRINYQCGDENYAMSPPYNITVHSTTLQKGGNTEDMLKQQMITSNLAVSSSGFSNLTGGSPESTCKGEKCLEGKERVGKVALIADMGIEGDPYTVQSILEYVKRSQVDVVVHAGDISYADDFGFFSDSNSWVWVEYMTSLQNVTARVPYMTAPGNHESEFNFAAYLNWLHMPWNESGSSSPFYYSFDYLGVHFVGISTEHDLGLHSAQRSWLEQDLKTADQKRAETPWILVFGHRPLYCSSIFFWVGRCTIEAHEYRRDLEDLFSRYHVDVYVSGHNHQYERSWPVSFGNVTAKNYNNPAGTVHIVTGAAGSPEPIDASFVPGFLAPWRAAYSETLHTGWTLMEVNSTALGFSYIHSVDSWKIMDRFTITKNK